MQYKTLLAATALLASGAVAQTPLGFSPETPNHLDVTVGSTYLIPGEELSQALTDSIIDPVISSTKSYPGTYLIALVDLSIPDYLLAPITPAELVPGLGTNRTTRLHWLQGNLTQAANHSFVSTSPALAPYAGPQPPLGDIPHDYTYFFFKQPANYQPSAAALSGAFQDPAAFARFNFSVPALAAQLGAPIAGNYMRVENSGNAALASASVSSAIAAAETGLASALKHL